MYRSMHIYIYAYVYTIRMCKCIYAFVYMYTYTCIHTYNSCTYVYMYIRTFEPQSKSIVTPGWAIDVQCFMQINTTQGENDENAVNMFFVKISKSSCIKELALCMMIVFYSIIYLWTYTILFQGHIQYYLL